MELHALYGIRERIRIAIAWGGPGIKERQTVSSNLYLCWIYRYDNNGCSEHSVAIWDSRFDMERGDLVCVIFGCDKLLLLRKVDNNYIVIGECFGLRVMDGEAINDLRDGNYMTKNSWSLDLDILNTCLMFFEVVFPNIYTLLVLNNA